jgi:hypothetical protein
VQNAYIVNCIVHQRIVNYSAAVGHQKSMYLLKSLVIINGTALACAAFPRESDGKYLMYARAPRGWNDGHIGLRDIYWVERIKAWCDGVGHPFIANSWPPPRPAPPTTLVRCFTDGDRRAGTKEVADEKAILGERIAVSRAKRHVGIKSKIVFLARAAAPFFCVSCTCCTR